MRLPEKPKSCRPIKAAVVGRYILLFFLAVFVSCNTSGPNKFSDEAFVRIADLQDRRLSDSLYSFLQSSNAGYRKAAVLAFASIQDTGAIDALGKIFIHDPNAEVRTAAAFALGQTGSEKAFHYLYNKTRSVDGVTSEALGKTAINESGLANLTLWGLYRLALRGQANEVHVLTAIAYLDDKHEEDVRLGAAHFFGRGSQPIELAETALLQSLRYDPSPFVRMTVATALRKLKSPTVQRALVSAFEKEKDYRVRVNIVRALQPYSLAETTEVFSNALQDEQIHVAVAASEVIKIAALESDYLWIIENARSARHWRVRANLYDAALATTGSKDLSEEIVTLISAAELPYEKAALLGALAHAPMQLAFASEQLLKSPVPVIRSTAASAIVAMNRHPAFETSMKENFFALYKNVLLTSNDAAVIGTIASAFADSTLGYKNFTAEFNFLHEAKQRLSLPKDNEALQPLEAAIAYIEGRKHIPPVVNEFNHPIDWAFVKTIPRDQRVLIKTDKGNIEIKLFVEDAPGSVANFLNLVKTGYFNSKNFHRVVPNFVIQGGCNRGDGWGSEDYSIRSEFTMRKYKEGSVGMASAGKDTEGTQWFITHSPTPHLDGRYTLFAEVVKGMDVVHRIEVGDVIRSVEMLRN